ncbi:hypothetical protein [Spirulina sp. 06S082]|uniref:hypothetical protein n=1 Tax=Spirulina sp. 06S082 TaxID=3110248 RepID=UPI002B1E91B0|nr:hypothetical protein [Spirulina sp. 06S082]MEA5468055.1 hypothetical protein [Spirulina sp. 06S082]
MGNNKMDRRSIVTTQTDSSLSSNRGIESGNADETQNATCNCSLPNNGQECMSAETPPFDYVASGFGPDGQEIEDEPTSLKSLATIVLSNGARVEFYAVEEEDGYGIAMRELGDAERMMPSVLATMSNLSALEIYSKLCPNKPVPREIAIQAGLQQSVNLTDTIGEPLEADLDSLGIVLPVQFGSDSGGGWGGHFCIPGDGWHAFVAFACNGSYPANAWRWCDPNAAFFWRDRWTNGHKRKCSFGITATCGGPAETIHYYKKKSNGKWKRLKIWYLPNNHWQWTRYCGIAKRDRWVKHRSSIQGQPSFVRSFTAIYT